MDVTFSLLLSLYLYVQKSLVMSGHVPLRIWTLGGSQFHTCEKQTKKTTRNI